MKIISQVTDESIRWNVLDAIEELEEDEVIQFPDDDARNDFINECVERIIDNYETYDHDPCGYTPNYEDEVCDLAVWDGYAKD